MEKLVVSATEAAKLLKVRPDLLIAQLEAGEIPAYKEGTNWKIPADLLRATIENRAIKEAQERRRLHEKKYKIRDYSPAWWLMFAAGVTAFLMLASVPTWFIGI